MTNNKIRNCLNCSKEFEAWWMHPNKLFCSNECRTKFHYKLYREKIQQLKNGKKCLYCGYNKHPEILQFHHSDKKLKNKQISNIRTEKQLYEEIQKCILICPNCHFWLYYKN